MATNQNLDKVIYPELSYKIIGISFKVHSKLGNKYQEKYYQRAIEIELKNQNIIFKKELLVDLVYADKKIGRYFLDFLIDNKIFLEIKAADSFKLADFKQVEGYLKSNNIKLEILANFRTERLVYTRILNPNFICNNLP